MTAGVLNSLSPKHFRTAGLVDLEVKPPILWIRGTADAIVSDASYFDLNMLGKLGVIPGWPGDEVAPPQPMVTQTRDVLEAYAAAGGRTPRSSWRAWGTARTWNGPRSSSRRWSRSSAGELTAGRHGGARDGSSGQVVVPCLVATARSVPPSA